jgi:hypothetical protein
MPLGGGFVLPRLDGIPKSYPALAKEATAAEVARTLIQAGIAKPERWAQAKGSATEFVRATLDHWLDRNGRAKVERNFYLDIALTDRADPQSWHDGKGCAGPQRLYISVEVESAGYVVFGPTLRLLEKVHPRMPATFYQRFVGSVERWVRVYDYRDGLERVEQIKEWLAGELEAEYEMPDVEKAIPARAKQRPLSDRTLCRMARRARSSKRKRLLEGLLTLMENASQTERPVASEDVYEPLQDNNPAVPALLVVFERSDAIEGCFDEEAQTMLEAPPEPNVILPVNGRDAASVASAFEKLASMTQTLAAASALIELMPGNERTEGTRE